MHAIIDAKMLHTAIATRRLTVLINLPRAYETDSVRSDGPATILLDP